jgi:uncharacterized membrane protein
MKNKQSILKISLFVLALLTAFLIFNESDVLFQNSWKITALIFNIIIFIGNWKSINYQEGSSLLTRSILGILIAIIFNIGLGIYFKEYFYLSIILLGGVVEIFTRKK